MIKEANSCSVPIYSTMGRHMVSKTFKNLYYMRKFIQTITSIDPRLKQPHVIALITQSILFFFVENNASNEFATTKAKQAMEALAAKKVHGTTSWCYYYAVEILNDISRERNGGDKKAQEIVNLLGIKAVNFVPRICNMRLTFWNNDVTELESSSPPVYQPETKDECKEIEAKQPASAIPSALPALNEATKRKLKDFENVCTSNGWDAENVKREYFEQRMQAELNDSKGVSMNQFILDLIKATSVSARVAARK